MRKLLILFFVLLGTMWSHAQQPPVSGVIRDEKGEPVMFATINVKGTSRSARADDNGYFSITAKSTDSLVVSAAGYRSATVIASENIIVILMRSENEQLQEVVVTALGIQRQRKELGYSTAKVANTEINRASPVNIANGLQGKVSGLNIASSNNGIFSTVKISMRGIRSLMGNNNPMLLLDGIPTPLEYLSSINPNDIQDVTVLKGAASASLYGPDARNGVIVVTSKKGNKSNRPTITFTQTGQLESLSFFPKFQERFGSGGSGNYIPFENWSWGPEFDGSTRELGRPLEDGSVQEVIYSATDERKKFWNTGSVLATSVSLSVKDFYLSLQDASLKGIVPGDKNRRTGIRVNTSRDFGMFRASFNANYIQQNHDVFDQEQMRAYHVNVLGAGYNGGLMNLIFNTPAHVPITAYKDFEKNPYATYNNYFNDYGLNPYFSMDNWRQTGRNDDLLTNIELSVKPFSSLSITYRAALALNSMNITSISKGERPNLHGIDLDRSVISSSAAELNRRNSRLSSELVFNYNKSFGDFKVNAIAGHYFRQNDMKEVGVSASDLVADGIFTLSNRRGELLGDNPVSRSRLIGLYGNVGLSYKGWANLEVTGRNDWTSLLAIGNNSFFYPGVSTSLVLSDVIPAIQESKLISYLKLRANIQKTGNSDIAPYSLKSVYTQPFGFPFGNVVGYSASSYAYDENLQPEFTTSKELGLEISFLNNRINIEAAYFKQDNTNQIIPIRIPEETGYSNYYVNAASFTNSGLELDLKLTPLIRLGEFTVNLKMNATYNDSRIKNIYEGLDRLYIGGNTDAGNFAIAGQPAFVWMTTDYQRDEQGRVVVDDETGIPVVDPVLKQFGRTMPLWMIGISPEISYKGFTLSAVAEYKGGHYAYHSFGQDMAWTGVSAATAVNNRQPFVFPNSVYWDGSKYVPNTNVPIMDVTDFFTNTFSDASSNFITSAASWRLREVALTYSLPASVLNKLKLVKAASITVNARNLALWLPATNEFTDPDFTMSNAYNTTGFNNPNFSPNVSGFNNSQITPPTRIYGATLTVTF
jgi:TonB-linked SusC/RagA family outer membrane protein